VYTVGKTARGEVTVTAQVDGKKFLDWTGDASRLSLGERHPIVKAGKERCFWFHSHRSTFALTKLELRPIGAAAAQTANGTSVRDDSSLFVGRWDCGWQGRSDVMTLNADFTAHKNRPNPRGKWECVNGEAHIAWDDGLRTVVRRDGEGFQKLTWKAGASLDSPPWPAWTTRAVKIGGQPKQPAAIATEQLFVGVWDCGDIVITLNADFTARNNRNGSGKWECVNGEAHIVWNSGAKNVLRRDGEGFQKLMWKAGRGLDSQPVNVFPAHQRPK
jgi:hypothetical protein